MDYLECIYCYKYCAALPLDEYLFEFFDDIRWNKYYGALHLCIISNAFIATNIARLCRWANTCSNFSMISDGINITVLCTYGLSRMRDSYKYCAALPLDFARFCR
jgi:hypothetical protein